jgi:hypothetical protein
MTYAIEGNDDELILFASWEECSAWMDRWASGRYPQPTRFRYSVLNADEQGVLQPVSWQTFEHKGAKVRKPTAAEEVQDELDRMAYYRRIDMHSTTPVSAPVWVPPTRYEGF